MSAEDMVQCQFSRFVLIVDYLLCCDHHDLNTQGYENDKII